MNNCTWDFQGVLNRRADAFARIRGSDDYPEIQGIVRFYQTNRGVIVSANVSGLPTDGSKPCEERVFGFHVHMGESCTGNEKDPFSDTLSHYNPHNCLHPMHAGDLPPLFENDGRAFMTFLTNRFSVKEIIGRTVVVHAMPDDFRTQPSGDSGMKIACGVVVRV